MPENLCRVLLPFLFFFSPSCFFFNAQVFRTQRRVVAGMLPQKGLVGSLPPHPGKGLRHLTRLVMFGNALHG